MFGQIFIVESTYNERVDVLKILLKKGKNSNNFH